MLKTDKEKKLIHSFKKLKHEYPIVYRLVLFTLILLVIIIPFFTYIFYLVGSLFEGIPTTINAGEALGFWGSLLTFIGTVTLGIIALVQNSKIAKINNDLIRLQAQEYLPILQVCNFSILNVESNKNINKNKSISKQTRIDTNESRYTLNILDNYDSTKYDFDTQLRFSLKNISRAKISKMNLTNVEYYFANQNGSIDTKKDYNSISTLLLPNLKTNISIYFYYQEYPKNFTKDDFINLKLTLEIICIDKSTSKQTLDVRIINRKLIGTEYYLE